MRNPVYIDCNATTPLEQRVCEEMWQYYTKEYGNEGSRTHEYGARAKQAVQLARDQVASVVGCSREEVIFTSGATESNNIALLGMAEHGEKIGKKHIVSTSIEHKAVLEPLELLVKRGFEVTLLKPNSKGRVLADMVEAALRPDTLLVSVMHANNETGVIQPILEIAHALKQHDAYFHVDAAQTFGKLNEALRAPRLDLISASGHKIYGPKGIGVLIMRRRGYEKVPLVPLMVGGGQERGLRPGTLPVPIVVGMGCASKIAVEQEKKREEINLKFRERLLTNLRPLQPELNGDQEHVLPHCISLAFPGVDSETAMVAFKGLIAVSNGSACTSATYKPSYVLESMGLTAERISGTIRFSWCHMTEEPDWEQIVSRVKSLGV